MRPRKELFNAIADTDEGLVVGRPKLPVKPGPKLLIDPPI
jgi:hypothetical protein